MKTDYGYKCDFCPKEYKEKFNYDRHVVCCEFLCKSRREQINDIETNEQIPTQREMYRLIQELAMRNNKLEKELTKLKDLQKRKINIIDWLQKTQHPNTSFIEWINSSVVVKIKDVLEIVYSNDLLTGFNRLFDIALENNSDNLPIRAYENKAGTFYVYKKNDSEEGGTWKQISNNDFDKILSQISRQFIVEFKRNWFDPKKELVETDEKYKDVYIDYYERILGGNERISEAVRFQRVRQTLYNNIKQNIKTVIEYDFV